jgi:hypothetical protein
MARFTCAAKIRCFASSSRQTTGKMTPTRR